MAMTKQCLKIPKRLKTELLEFTRKTRQVLIQSMSSWKELGKVLLNSVKTMTDGLHDMQCMIIFTMTLIFDFSR